jgi:hypothetical protein
MTYHLAIDIGASSGRHILGHLEDGKMVAALRELIAADLITLYEVNGKPYLQMNTWDNHQQIRAKKSKFPGPECGTVTSDIICNQMISIDSKCPRNPIQSNPIRIQSESESENESNRNPTREKLAQESARETFDVFWTAYPKKVGKKDAFKAFQKVPVSERPLLIPAIERQKQSRQWNDEGGRFIPNPSTWLNQGRWMDEGVDDSIVDRPKSRVAQELEESYDIIKQWVKEEKARNNDD